MQRFVVFPILLALAAASFGQEPRTTVSICVKHIETPIYPPIARAAHVVGKVELKLTIDAAGRVTDTHIVRGTPLLASSAQASAQHWTFSPPPSPPYSLTVVYDYDFDCDDPIPDVPVTKVVFDLPNLVKIVTTCPPNETLYSKPRR